MTSFDSQIQQVLQRQEFSGIVQPFEYIDGVVFAVAAAPEIPLPDEWLIWVFAQRGQLSSTAQADLLTDNLMQLLKQKLAAMRAEQGCFPQDLAFPQSYQLDEPVSLWLQGVLAGHSQLEDIWQKAWQQMQRQQVTEAPQMAKALKHCLGMFTTFADIPLALRQAELRGNKLLADKLPEIYLALPKAVDTYVCLSGKLAGYLPDQFETFVSAK